MLIKQSYYQRYYGVKLYVLAMCHVPYMIILKITFK